MTVAAAILYALASGSMQATPAPAAAQTPAPATPATAPAPPPAQVEPADEPETTDQDAAPEGEVAADAYDLGEVAVTSAKPRGSVQGDIPPDVTLSADQIKAYGASNLAELLTNLEPLTRSSSGRSDQQPIILLNGRRTSGFQEIRGIPIEAIERTEILPEQVALTYGYAADRRVVNIVIKAAFQQASVVLKANGPSQGGRLTSEIDGNFFSIQAGDRWNVDIERQHDTALFESERDIVREPAANQAATDDLTAYRTLLSRGDRSTVRASLARDLNTTTKATLSGSLEDSSTTGFNGLPGFNLNVPGSNPYSLTGVDAQVYRTVENPSALMRNTDSLTGNMSALVDGFLGDWRYSLSGSFDYVETDSSIGRGLDASALQQQITFGNPTYNPYGVLPLGVFSPLGDTSRSVSTGGNAEGLLNGKLWQGPAGDMQSTFKFGLDTRKLESESLRSGVSTQTDLSRERAYGSFNVSVPIASARRDFLPALGELSVSLNGGYDEYSDFGGLTTLGAGVNWAPKTFVSFNANYSNEQGAPTINQINDPVVSTPNTPIYDFRANNGQGQTVNVNYITGGNRNLDSDTRQVLRLGTNLTPFQSMNLTFNATYTWARTEDAITAFPTITPDLEAALPERFVRDSAGALISIDARPLNFTKTERQDVRTGFNFSRAFGTPSTPAPGTPGAVMGAFAGGPGGGRPAAGPRAGGGGTQVRIGGGPGGGGGRGSSFQPGQGMLNLSVYYTYRIQDEITIRNDLPVLDLLDGAATGSRGGSSRSEVQVQAGVFRNGFGAFVNANWREGTQVNGGLNSSDLSFSDLATVNVNTFMDLNQRTKLVERFPWLKGSRVSLGVSNLFDERIDVTSSTGRVPLNYQPDFLDPQGRVIRVELRKILF